MLIIQLLYPLELVITFVLSLSNVILTDDNFSIVDQFFFPFCINTTRKLLEVFITIGFFSL